jgi:N6-L-threonylcarbamoyladenine synthase
VIAKGDGDYHTIGRTVDDAAGEAYDKVARLLQLGYPGGPIVDKLAKTGNPDKIAFSKSRIRAEGSEYNFSFSGLKTAVINYYRKNPNEKTEDICASFQKTVVETLVEKTVAAAKEYNIKDIYLAGGVAANSGLREYFSKTAKEEDLKLTIPPFKYCTDNAAMIGGAAIIDLKAGKFSEYDLKANPALKL